MDKNKTKQDNKLLNLLKSGAINNLYFNESVVGVSDTDVIILLKCNGKEEVILNASYVTAKSLAIMLNNAISAFEEETGQKIMVPEHI